MRLLPIPILLFLILPGAGLAAAADPAALLPVPSCGVGWKLDGKTAVYDRETLSDRIDGEAELFLPYGFQFLANARYAKGESGFDLDIYRMGSPLDAFAMYANYRPGDSAAVPTGTAGAVTPAQLFFYQERYFVRLQSTGPADAGKGALTACARAVSSRLPKSPGPPEELELLAIAEVPPESVRYSATSLLGYAFFPRGMTGDAVVAGEPARVFVVIADSEGDAATALAAYRSYLKESGVQVPPEEKKGELLITLDPLYGRVLVQQAGRYLVGIARVKEASAGLPVLEKLRARAGK